MFVRRLLPVLLIACIVLPLFAACGANTVNTAPPASNIKSPPPFPTPALDLDYGSSMTYTANTELPPLKISDTQFSDVSPSTPGRYEYRSNYIASESVFETVFKSLKTSYDEPFDLRFNPNKNTTTAFWMTEDSLFMMSLVLDHRYGKPVLELYVTKWPGSNAELPAPASNAGANATYTLDYGLTKTFTKNTDVPYRIIGDTLFYNETPPESCGRGVYTYSAIPKDGKYESALKTLKSAYGEPYELKLNEKKKTPEAFWQNEDGSFKMYLLVAYRYGQGWLKLVIIYTPGSNAQPQETNRPYTKNTDMPQMKIADIQFYKSPRSSPGEYEFYSDKVQSDSAFDAVLESLKASYGACVRNHFDAHQGSYDMTTASWISEDYTFSLDLILYKLDDGSRYLQLLVYKWPE